MIHRFFYCCQAAHLSRISNATDSLPLNGGGFMRRHWLKFLLCLGLVCLHATGHGYNDKATPDCQTTHLRYVFSWPLSSDCLDRPRGGITEGAPVTFDPEPKQGWQAIQEPGLSKLERDRRAILAMAGPYKVSFDFLETLGFDSNFKRDKPYQSWGTEYIYVVENEPHFISLQHLMVMRFKQKDGSISEPMVMKHWRQDWTYQDKELLIFEHRDQWRKTKLSRTERKGQWSQAVFQVDDSPRYESYGRWEHNGSFSTWISQTTRRPLPRREASVRDDYQVLEGFNRHSIHRYGWVQEEENWKLVVDKNGQPDSKTPYLAKELGLARYQPIIDYDFTPGDAYMALAGQFWTDVRKTWGSVFAEHKKLHLLQQVDQQPLFMPLFNYAQQVMEQGTYDTQAGRAFANQQIRAYIK